MEIEVPDFKKKSGLGFIQEKSDCDEISDISGSMKKNLENCKNLDITMQKSESDTIMHASINKP